MLIGKNVILEEIMPENIEQMRVWRNQPELRQFFREFKDITPDQQLKWYNERGNNTNANHVYFQIMAIDSRSPERQSNINNRYLIGCCSLSYIDWRLRSAEFGVYLGKDRGTGKGKEALELMFSYGFSELNLHKVWAEVWDSNNAINLYKKIGFKEDGRLRDNYFHNGKYGDSIMISIMENEWREKYGKLPIYHIDGLNT